MSRCSSQAGRQCLSVCPWVLFGGGGYPRSVPHPLGLKGWTHLLLSSSIVTDSRRVNPRSLQRRMRHLIHFLDWIRSALVGIALSSPAPCSALYREREREREKTLCTSNTKAVTYKHVHASTAKHYLHRTHVQVLGDKSLTQVSRGVHRLAVCTTRQRY